MRSYEETMASISAREIELQCKTGLTASQRAVAKNRARKEAKAKKDQK